VGRDTLVLDIEINRETALAAAESARSAFASVIGNSPFLGGSQGGGGFSGGRFGSAADNLTMSGYGAMGVMPGGGSGTPAGGVPNYPFFGAAAGATASYGTTTIPGPASAIPQTTLGQFAAGMAPGMFAPSNMPQQFFGAAMQTQFQERAGYGLVQGALGAGASALQGAGTVVGALGGSAIGSYAGQALGGGAGTPGGEIGSYLGGFLGSYLGGPIGGALGEMASLPLNLTSERLGNERDITNVFRSQGYRAGLGPGVARELQPTLRGLGQTIAESSGTPGTPFYDPGAIARGEDPAERAGQMTQMALSSGALGRNLDYRRPGELLGRLGQAHDTMMTFERTMGLSLPEAGGTYAALRRGGLYDPEEIRKFGSVQAGLNYTGLGEPGTDMRQQTQDLLQVPDEARKLGVAAGPALSIAQRQYARLGAASVAGYVPEESMQMLGGQMGAAKQISGAISKEGTEDNPIGTTNLLVQASMKSDGTVDVEKAKKLAGLPVHQLVAEAQRNMSKSGMNPVEFLGLMEFNKVSMQQQLEEEAPGLIESTYEGGIRGMATMFQKQAGQRVGSEGPRVGYLQQAARQMGLNAEQARVVIGNMNQQTEGITGGLDQYTEGINQEAKAVSERGLTGAFGQLKESMRRGGADLARPIEKAGEGLAEELIRGLDSSNILQELLTVLQSLASGSHQGGSDLSRLMDQFRGRPNVVVGASQTGGR